ncbi:MAG: hypothetical protein ACOVMN_08915 [Flexibacteraceae bacterium]
MTKIIKQTPNEIATRRVNGNFLWTIYTNAPRYKQIEFKSKLIEAGGQNQYTLWQSFNKIQTIEGKEDNFNAEIIGIMVQVMCENDIKLKFELTDLEKLKMKYCAIIQNKQETLPLFRN